MPRHSHQKHHMPSSRKKSLILSFPETLIKFVLFTQKRKHTRRIKINDLHCFSLNGWMKECQSGSSCRNGALGQRNKWLAWSWVGQNGHSLLDAPMLNLITSPRKSKITLTLSNSTDPELKSPSLHVPGVHCLIKCLNNWILQFLLICPHFHQKDDFREVEVETWQSSPKFFFPS